MRETSAFPAERTAVVTGAGSERGIGRATADLLARDGWSVALLDIDDGAADKAARSIAEARGAQAVGIGVDVSDQASVIAAITEVEQTLPPIVGLVNLAGISSPTDFMDETVSSWDRVFAVNTRGPYLVSQRVLTGMIDRRLGRIVNASSISAQRGGGTYSKVAYSASKAGVIGFTRALAREVGGYGITVNSVAPGPIDTDIMGGALSEERKAEMAADTLMGRVGTRDDVAALIGFLVSEQAGWITAATYDINGGLQIS